MSTLLDKTWYMTALQNGDLELQGQFLHGSNYTFFGRVTHEGQQFEVVYKPTRGEQPLWDFPSGSLAKREVAAYLVSEGLGWDLVPPTVYRRKAELGPGSLQLYVQHDPNNHYFNFTDADRQRLRPVVTFDLVINNADRKGGHVILDPQDHFWLIDHGICFHVEDKLRTVIWDFAGETIPTCLLDDLRRFSQDLRKVEETLPDLLQFLRMGEVNSMRRRCEELLESKVFPLPGNDRRMYPWPPV